MISTLDSNIGNGWYSYIAVDSNNKLHISYYDATNGALRYAVNSSGSWVLSDADTDNAGLETSIAVDSKR